MSTIAIDASLGCSWVLRAQATAASDALLASGANDYVVPSLFWFEVRNAVLMSERRGRVEPALADKELLALARQTIEIEQPPNGGALAAIHDLARRESLTFYDASYLELALRRRLPLASRDSALLSAAVRRGVQAMDLR